MARNWSFTRDEIPLKALPSGHRLSAPVFRLQGPGPLKCYIQANNHGGEIAGNGAIFALLEQLQSYDIYGTIVIVPHCNPVSLNTRIDDSQIGVYDAATGQNWNRLFQLPVSRGPSEWQLDVRLFAAGHRGDSWPEIKSAYRRGIGAALERLRSSASVRGLDYRTHFALALQGLSMDADFVLDLHTGDIAPRYLYAPEYARTSAPWFHIPHVLFMQNEFGGSFDEVNFCPWWTLLEEMRALGRADIDLDVEAYTVELGSLETIRAEDMEKDALRILNYLRHKGMVAGAAQPPGEPLYACRIQDYLSYCAPASGLAVIDIPPGTHLAAGQELGYILSMRNLKNMDHLEEAQTPLYVQEDGILITRFRSPIVFEGQVLFKCMTRISRLEVSR